MDEGHCGLPEEELGPLAAKLLEVPGELIRAALDLELSEGTVVADTVGEIPCIFLGGLHRAERAIAGRIIDIAAGNLPWPDIDPGKALPWVEGKTGLALAPGQADAVRAALSSKVSVITGGPGVGKTTIVNSILRILSAKDVDILLCAPTGRAAKRMSEARRRRVAIAVRNASGRRRWSEAGRMAGRYDGRCGIGHTHRCRGTAGIDVDRRHALRVNRERDRTGWWGRENG